MSKVNKIETAPALTEETKEIQDFSVGVNDSQAGSSHVRRVVVTCNASAEELTSGKVVNIHNAADVFKPNYSV